MARVEINEVVWQPVNHGRYKVLAVARQADGLGLTVQVNKASDGTAATVYAAATGGTTLSNPLTSDPDTGRIDGWIDEGAYDLVISGNSEFEPYTQRYIAALDSAESISSLLATTEAGKPLVGISKLPGNVTGEYGWNGTTFLWDTLWTDSADPAGATQYAVWIDDSRNPWIAKRLLPNGAVTSQALAAAASGALNAPVDPNFHNGARVAVDSAGYIHVLCNFHAATFRYIRSTNPRDITAWTNATSDMPQDPSSNGYPTIVKRGDGKLLCFYRNGTSGNGDFYANVLNTAPAGWAAIGKILEGTTDSPLSSPYWNRIVVEQPGQAHPGRLHLSWTWRVSGGANGHNTDLGYGYSDDGGVTWKKKNGVAYTLPITRATTDKLLSTVSTGVGMLNSCGASVDKLGRYHTVMFRNDGSGNTQFHHIWIDTDGTTVHDDTITNFAHAYDSEGGVGGVIGMDYARPVVISTANGRTYCISRSQYDGLRGKVFAIDITPGVTSWPLIPIMQLDLHDWEPIIDVQALNDRDELHMICVPMKISGSASLAEFYDASLWKKQLGFVASYDLSRFAEVMSGKARLPRIQSIRQSSGPAATISTTATGSSVDLATGISVPVTPQDTRGRLLVGRMSVRGNINAGTTAAALTTALTGTNNDLVYTSKVTGPTGNSITVAYVVSGNSTTLLVTVTGSAISVRVATDGSGNPTSTAAQIAAAIAASTAANALVSVANAGGNDGSGVVTALTATALTGGSSILFNVILHERNDSGATADLSLCVIPFDSLANLIKEGPWFPLQSLPPTTTDAGWLTLWGALSSAGTGRVMIGSSVALGELVV